MQTMMPARKTIFIVLTGSALAIGESIEEVRRWPAEIEAVQASHLAAAAERYLVPARSVTGYLTKAQDSDAPVAMAAE